MFPHNVKWEESKNAVDMGILSIIKQDLKAIYICWLTGGVARQKGIQRPLLCYNLCFKNKCIHKSDHTQLLFSITLLLSLSNQSQTI